MSLSYFLFIFGLKVPWDPLRREGQRDQGCLETKLVWLQLQFPVQAGRLFFKKGESQHMGPETVTGLWQGMCETGSDLFLPRASSFVALFAFIVFFEGRIPY